MITYTKTINFYDKKMKPLKSEIKEKITFKDQKEAINFLYNDNLNFIKNEKGTSVFEEASILCKQNDNQFIRYIKSIDLKTEEITTNLPGEVEENEIQDRNNQQSRRINRRNVL